VDHQRLFALTNLQSLRELVVYHGYDEFRPDVLAANKSLRSLQRLRMHPSHSNSDSLLPRNRVVELFTSPNLPALRHLHLRGGDLGDEGCKALVESGILKRLETLDLRFGCITDAGARLLANCPDIRHLKHLSLEDNQLTDAGVELLEALPIEVELGEQHEVGGDEYLSYGDME